MWGISLLKKLKSNGNVSLIRNFSQLKQEIYYINGANARVSILCDHHIEKKDRKCKNPRLRGYEYCHIHKKNNGASSNEKIERISMDASILLLATDS